MPRKGGTRQPAWLVLLEDIRAQSGATIDAVETSHRLIARLEEKMEGRFTVVEQAQRATTHRLARLEERLGSVETGLGSVDRRVAAVELGSAAVDEAVRGLGKSIDRMGHRLGERVTALERRG
jgi:hypothetical protein